MPRNASTAARSRNQTEVKSGLEKSLKNYAVAAGAAGAGLLTLTQSAAAKIVFTPTHQTIISNGSLKIDLNADGITDFQINAQFFSSPLIIRNTGSLHPSGGYVWVQPSQGGNEAVFGSTSAVSMRKFAKAIPAGVKVGSSNKFLAGIQSMAACVGNGGPELEEGPWLGKSNRFLGLKFTVNGQTHFGWARFSVHLPRAANTCSFDVLLTGYAYETTANQPITTGQTTGAANLGSLQDLAPSVPEPTLGMLAAGFNGLDIWRREEDLRA